MDSDVSNSSDSQIDIFSRSLYLTLGAFPIDYRIAGLRPITPVSFIAFKASVVCKLPWTGPTCNRSK